MIIIHFFNLKLFSDRISPLFISFPDLGMPWKAIWLLAPYLGHPHGWSLLAPSFQHVGLDFRASQVHLGCYRLLPRITSYRSLGWVTLCCALLFPRFCKKCYRFQLNKWEIINVERFRILVRGPQNPLYVFICDRCEVVLIFQMSETGTLGHCPVPDVFPHLYRFLVTAKPMGNLPGPYF